MTLSAELNGETTVLAPKVKYEKLDDSHSLLLTLGEAVQAGTVLTAEIPLKVSVCSAYSFGSVHVIHDQEAVSDVLTFLQGADYQVKDNSPPALVPMASGMKEGYSVQEASAYSMNIAVSIIIHAVSVRVAQVDVHLAQA